MKAAKKAWKTRRENSLKASLSAKKAVLTRKRRVAAKKAWKTRRKDS